MLVVRGLVKSFGAKRVLDGVDLDVRAGEIVGLLGANGAGKSTTNRLISGLLVPEAGTVEIAGHDLARAPEAALAQLGYMPEAPALYPELTVAETLRLVGDLRGLEGAGEWAAKMLALFDLEHAVDQPVSALSMGMRRKLTLAWALAGDPGLLVLDEPTNGFDPPAVALFKQIVVELRRRGRAVLVSSHILALLEPLCDRVAILEGGRLCAAGTIEELRVQAGLPGADLEALYLALTGRTSMALDF